MVTQTGGPRNTGYLVLHLNAHLPFVRHPEHESALEENWLFEAISETYLPLLRILDGLDEDGVPCAVSLSISPTLTTMLRDELLQRRYLRHCERMVDLACREVDRTRGHQQFGRMAEYYRSLYETNLRDFVERYECDLTRGFDYHYKRGRLEILATAATHAYLPIYVQHPPAVRAQVHLGVDAHVAVFGKAPKGFWLPECGYAPGTEEYLRECGIRYTFLSTHGVVFSDPRPRSGVYAPLRCENGLAVFGRDHVTTNAVWSAEDGYPADVSYRDFYRDIGHDLPIDYIGPFLPGGRLRVNTGFKYHAITGKTDRKVPYDMDGAERKIGEHAANFLYNVGKRVSRLAELMDTPPVISCLFDAELFGHWWFEGPRWLDAVIRGVAGSSELSLVTPCGYLKHHPDGQVAAPSFSSWGTKGYSEVWLDGSNDWIYPHVHKAIERMAELNTRFPTETGLRRRALNQAAREVLLSMASDWPFIMRAGTAVPYAVRRVKDHVANVGHVYEMLSRASVGTEWLTRVERRHTIFPDIDYRLFAWPPLSTPFSVRLNAPGS